MSLSQRHPDEVNATGRGDSVEVQSDHGEEAWEQMVLSASSDALPDEALNSRKDTPETLSVAGSGRREREEELTRLVAERERQLLERDLAYRRLLRDRELAMALSGRSLVAGAAVQLLKLWRDEFDVVEEVGECRVVSREGRTVGQAVEEWLAKPEYAHFRPAASRGGAGAISGHQVAAVEGLRAAATLGDSLVKRWREGSDGSSAEGVSIGLNRRRRTW